MDYTNLKERMEKSIGAYIEKLSEIRAGRANPAILNKVRIDYYGTPTPINQVAGISVPEARLIVIQPWDISSRNRNTKNNRQKYRRDRQNISKQRSRNNECIMR